MNLYSIGYCTSWTRTLNEVHILIFFWLGNPHWTTQQKTIKPMIIVHSGCATHNKYKPIKKKVYIVSRHAGRVRCRNLLSLKNLWLNATHIQAGSTFGVLWWRAETPNEAEAHNWRCVALSGTIKRGLSAAHYQKGSFTQDNGCDDSGIGHSTHEISLW